MISLDAVYAEVKAAMATVSRIDRTLVEIRDLLAKIEERIPADGGITE